MAVVCGRPGIKGSCGKRRMRLNYLAGDGLRGRFWSFGAASAHLQGEESHVIKWINANEFDLIMLFFFSI